MENEIAPKVSTFILTDKQRSAIVEFGSLIPKGSIIVKFRINETLRIGAVGKPHLPGKGSVYLFLGFTINRNLTKRLKQKGLETVQTKIETSKI